MNPKLLGLIHRWNGTRNDRDHLKEHIKNGLDISAVDENGQNILHWIARNRAQEPYADDVARALVESGADANCADAYGNLPLHYACAYTNDSTFVSNAFLRGADVNHANHAGERPLHWAQCAADDESAHITWTLLQAGARLNSRDDQKRSPLHWALARGQDEGAVRLLRAGANPNAVDRHGRTPAYWAGRRAQRHIAAQRYMRGDVKETQTIFNEKAEKARTDNDPAYNDFRNSEINREGAMLLLPILAECGADFERADREAGELLHEGQSLARFYAEEVAASHERFLDNVLAKWQPHLDRAAENMLSTWLRQRKQENGDRLPEWCCTGELGEKLAKNAASMTAYQGGNWLKELAKGGLDLSKTDAMEVAVGANRWRTLEWLIEQAPEQVNARDRHGQTLLHIAAGYAHLECALQLLDAGADVHARDHDGRTPLHHAAPYYDRERDDDYDFTWTKHDTKMCRLLMAAGADPHALDAEEQPTCLVQNDLRLDPNPFSELLNLSHSQPASGREPEFHFDEIKDGDLTGLKSLKETVPAATPPPGTEPEAEPSP